MSKVKVCGLSRPADIAAANRALPDYIGFVFAPSRRQVGKDTAATLKADLDPRIEAVGVFVNAALSEVTAIYRSGSIDLVQLHGTEDDAYIRQLKADCGCRVIKAVAIDCEADGHALPSSLGEADYLLFDSLSVRHGGSGRAFDWGVLHGYHGIPYFLAGGLNAEVVGSAIGQLSPFAVDVSTGVETDGKKDEEKIMEFVRRAREA
ncbi:MAG: phosphoribosylanthranilate isomerase [Actinomycetia bacterium]|nr:phosphoribosylanthranilate isomerase [Actinomycetes bacterium]